MVTTQWSITIIYSLDVMNAFMISRLDKHGNDSEEKTQTWRTYHFFILRLEERFVFVWEIRMQMVII